MTGPDTPARSLSRLWPAALCVIVWVVTVVIMISAASSPLAVLGFVLWAALPYVLVVGLVLLTAGRSGKTWLVATVLAVVVAGYGLFVGVTFLRSDDAQAGLIWLFGPLYQLIGTAVVGLPVLIVAFVRHPVADR